VTWFGVPEARFSLTSGTDVLRWFASSEKSERGFCTTCGTTMFYRSSLAPGEMHIALACADGPIDREPSVHIFVEARVPWVELGDHLPQIDRTHPGIAKYQSVPRTPADREGR
jgi:hypothetical protein